MIQIDFKEMLGLNVYYFFLKLGPLDNITSSRKFDSQLHSPLNYI